MSLRLRSDEQLVRLFRAGNEDAFTAIHDRYRTRLFAYARQMLGGSSQDAEDALQDVFVRAYAALRAGEREISLRAWLYRIMHNRCIDQLRRPLPPAPETLALLRPPADDPIAITDRRETLRQLVADVRRLPDQQRSALLMREIGGMSYDEIATALELSVTGVKSTLTRARMSLTTAAEARDTACIEIREQLIAAHDRGIRFNGVVRRHLHNCDVCRAYRSELRTTSKRFAALTPAVGPSALLAKLFGGTALLGGGAGAAALSGTGATVTGAAAGGGAIALTTGQIAAFVAVAAIGTGGVAELPHGGTHARRRDHASRAVTLASAAATTAATLRLPRQHGRPGAAGFPKRATSTRSRTPGHRPTGPIASAAQIAGEITLAFMPDGRIEMTQRGALPRHASLAYRASKWFYLDDEGKRAFQRLMAQQSGTATFAIGRDGTVKSVDSRSTKDPRTWRLNKRASHYYTWMINYWRRQKQRKQALEQAKRTPPATTIAAPPPPVPSTTTPAPETTTTTPAP